MFDKEALEILLIRSKRNKEELAKYIGINEVTLYRKMNVQSEWKRNEMLLTAKFFGELDLSAIFLLRRLIDFGKKICKLPTKIYTPHYCTKCSIEAENGDIDELDQASKRKCLWSD